MMTDFNRPLRKRLAEIAIIRPPQVDEVHVSPEGTKKYLIKLDSGSMVEMVRIPEKKENNSMHLFSGRMCITMYFLRNRRSRFWKNLTAAEIIGQVWLANFYDSNESNITNVVFMGMGEPLLNFTPVVESAKIMKDQLAYGLSRKRITISTSGITPQIDQLTSSIDVSLAISLHAPIDSLRDQIVPINKKYPIKMLMNSCKNYLSFYEGKRSVTIEYILIDGVNDSQN